jgi:SSS family solute:Na+ symporter
MLYVGYRMGRDEESTEDFFLGGRSVPAWAACLSFVATEISALTLTGVPATAYKENWAYAQMFVGSAAARIAIAFLFIPVFFKFECTTIYEYLLHRFGPLTQRTASVFFFITRLLGSGVRLYAACGAVHVLVGIPLELAIFLFTVLGVFYIGYGGVKAVVWTNVVQAVALIGGGVGTLLFFQWAYPGGFLAAMGAAGAAGKTQIWNWGPPPGAPDFWWKWLADPTVVVLAIANGFLGSLAAFGTDHDLMQRLLTVKTRGESQRTLVATIAGSLVVLATYLSVGACLWAWYSTRPAEVPKDLDMIYPYFVNTVLPAGLRGLMLAAIVLASIDSPLGSLSASFVTDIYKPLLAPGRKDAHYLLVGRIAVAVFGAILALLALWFSRFADQLWLAFQIGGVTFGSLLGVFLLGLLTEREGDRGNAVGMVVAAVVMAALWAGIRMKWIALGWTWMLPLGTAITMGIGWAMGRPRSHS